MEKTNLLTLVIGLTVGIILTGSLLMPVLADTTTTENTFTNTGYFRYTEIDDTETYSYTFDEATFNKITVNGEDMTIWQPNNGLYNLSLVMIPDIGIIRYNASQSAYTSSQVVGIGTLSLANGYTVTFDNGTYTITNASNSSITGTYTKAYAPIPDGEYILKKSNDKAYLSDGSTIIGDSDFIAMGVTNVTAWNNGFQIVGTLSDYDVTVYNPSDNTFVISDVTDDKAAVANYNNLYTLSKIMFNITDSEDDTVDVDATYSYFLVPYQVNAELAQHLNAGEIALLNALPVLIIIGLVMVAVGAIALRRND